MDVVFDAIGVIGPALRGRTRGILRVVAALVAMATLMFPPAPVLAPARWFVCGWYVRAVQGAQAAIDRIGRVIDSDHDPAHEPVEGPEPWC